MNSNYAATPTRNANIKIYVALGFDHVQVPKSTLRATLQAAATTCAQQHHSVSSSRRQLKRESTKARERQNMPNIEKPARFGSNSNQLSFVRVAAALWQTLTRCYSPASRRRRCDCCLMVMNKPKRNEPASRWSTTLACTSEQQ